MPARWRAAQSGCYRARAACGRAYGPCGNSGRGPARWTPRQRHAQGPGQECESKGIDPSRLEHRRQPLNLERNRNHLTKVRGAFSTKYLEYKISPLLLDSRWILVFRAADSEWSDDFGRFTRRRFSAKSLENQKRTQRSLLVWEQGICFREPGVSAEFALPSLSLSLRSGRTARCE